MKMIVAVALALLAVAAAAPAGEEPVQIVRSEYEHNPDGSYTAISEGADGIKREEIGELKEVIGEDGKPHLTIVVRGSYSYTDDTGTPVSVSYSGDEFGFKAEGDTIPKPQ